MDEAPEEIVPSNPGATNNSHRPHRALNLRRPRDVGRPIPGPERARPEETQRRAILGGLIHEYHARAA
jgi:hypothetical protein